MLARVWGFICGLFCNHERFDFVYSERIYRRCNDCGKIIDVHDIIEKKRREAYK